MGWHLGTPQVGQSHGACSATRNSARFSEVRKALLCPNVFADFGSGDARTYVLQSYVLLSAYRRLLCLLATNLHPKELLQNDIQVMDVL